VGLAVIAFTGPGINKLTRSDFTPEPYSTAGEVRLVNGIRLKTTAPEREERQLTLSSPRHFSCYWLVHFSAPIRQEWLNRLRQHGYEPLCYLAYQTVVIRFDRQNQKKRSDIPAEIKSLLPAVVDHVGLFLPEYKLAPELKDKTSASGISVSFWPGENSRTVVNIPGAVDIRHLAQQEEIAWIQRADPVEPLNCNVQWVIQTGWDSVLPATEEKRRFYKAGISGQGMVIGLFDSGIYTEHNMFRDPWLPLEEPGIYLNHRKIVAYKLFRNAAFGDPSAVIYHGTAVAGTLAGNDSPCGNLSNLDGVAPEARIYFLDITTASGQYLYSEELLEEMLDSIRLSNGMPEPVYQVSGSFGSMDNLGYYRLGEAVLDAVCWRDKKFLIIWAAGNGGGGRYRIGHPACAKNCLTVGGCGNSVRSNLVYSGSSGGPTRDGRIKPNILAPAESIFTVFGAGINTYRIREGTSFAAPATSGALALVRQYFKEGRYPTGTPEPSHSLTALSAALFRGLAICAADTNIGSRLIPSERIGWGRINLSNILHLPDDSIAITFIDETLGLATGQFDEYQIEVDRREPLKVILTWTDTAAAPAAAIAIINDLNLELISPDGNRYRGNQLYQNQSIPNPDAWDEINVEELCQIAHPLPGVWKIRVYARNVFTPRQPYALVVRGGIKGLPPGIEETAHPSSLTSFSALTPTIHRRTSSLVTIPAGATLQLWTVTGRLALQLTAPVSSPLQWNFSTPASRKINSGIYFYRLISSRHTSSGKIIILK